MARLILLGWMFLAYPFSHYLAGKPWLYMFAHASLIHLAINAITLWSFGKPVERELGPAQTLALFMVAAVVGGALQSIVTPGVAIMGASAGIFGLVAAFVARNPKVRIGIPIVAMFPGPPVLIVLMVLSLACIVFGWLPGVAHAAHLGGILIGLTWSRA
jgi:membrane associated rhomboid family serine protease